MKGRRLVENPFFVLGLDTSCTRLEMERQGQKLLAMLEVGFAEAASYASPFGERERTAEAIREAMAALRDPRRRLVAELWARAPTAPREQTTRAEPIESTAGAGGGSRLDPFPVAMRAFGWGRR